ncbi:MAG: helix-turn-helix domain-containing protein, partial [Pseudomonadota bacterium]|nr:helix-turn-helix domain-containing protein [Pseudomonadota bacterium]
MEKSVIDKRDLSGTFRDRLKTLLQRSGLNQSTFAAAVGIDRSALSQLLSGASTRLPRAETLINIAAEHKVSLDWLLGLSQDEGITGDLRESLEIAEAQGGFDDTMLARWHAEAVGTKIRYVPSGIPDLLRTEAVILYESEAMPQRRATQISEARYRVDYNRRPETDMEVCMPRQTLELFAKGEGMWRTLSEQVRAEQII